MAVEIDIGIDVDVWLENFLSGRFAGDRIPSIIEDIRFSFFDILARRLKGGDSDWPVDTGFSEGMFFAEYDGLYNHADYAIYVEAYTGAVNQYVKSNFDELASAALNEAGYPDEERQKQDRFRRDRISILRRYTDLARGVRLGRQLTRVFRPNLGRSENRGRR